jgi:hypothetical protein
MDFMGRGDVTCKFWILNRILARYMGISFDVSNKHGDLTRFNQTKWVVFFAASMGFKMI